MSSVREAFVASVTCGAAAGVSAAEPPVHQRVDRAKRQLAGLGALSRTVHRIENEPRFFVPLK